MIPKIIHYCWFGSDIPESVSGNIDKWKSVMPDYEFIQWDSSLFPREKLLWVDQACDNHKYAFAADYVRLYALYEYGGIYLDTDIDVLKPFDDLLDLPYFIGQEKTITGIESATIGFPPKFPLIKQLMNRYEGRSFVKSDGTLDMEEIPELIRRYIEAQYEYNVISRKSDFSDDPRKFNVFTADFFSPKRHDTGKVEITENTYSVHYFYGSWVPHDNCNIKPKNLGLRQKLVRSLLLRKDIVVVSNSMYEAHFNEKFGLHSRGPLWNIFLSEEDFCELARLGKEAFNRDICFFDCKEAKTLDKKDFNIVARIEGTGIELHFKKCFTKEQAYKRWAGGRLEIGQKKVVYLCCSKEPSRRIDYMTCFLINLGRTFIKI